MCLMTLKVHATPSDSSGKITLPKLGDKVYLNGNGEDPQEYYASPFNVANVYELPNLVVSKKQSPYKRPFQTKATSIIKLGNIKLTAILDNFRDLKITNEKGAVLLQRQVTGTTS